MRSTRAGLTHAAAPGGRPFIVFRMKVGWELDPHSGAILYRGNAVAMPALPAGAEFRLAVPALASKRGKLASPDRELARYVHLLLPRTAVASEWLAIARGWDFCEAPQLPPVVSLP